jgi:tRNA(fMet)-specific endonuclease VapC
MSSATAPGATGDYALDTSVLILELRGDPAIHSRLVGASRLYIPSIALGELYVGALGSANPADAVAQVDALAAATTILSTDATTARVYGQAKQHLRRQGQTIPDNDLWIASTAIQYNLTLAARDAHFNRVVGLLIEQW